MGSVDGQEQHDQGQGEPSQQEGQEGEQKGSNPLETLVSVVSALLLLGAVAFLVWEGVSRTEPPSFEVQTGAVRLAGEHYYLPLEVRNTGGESVQNLGLSVMLKEGSETVAQAQTSLAWLPARSHRRVVVIFEENPQSYQVEIGFQGYELP